MHCKTKSFMTKKRAFTLIELLIVIAIIGILFIVLVSKVDFATDKAKASGVQTDFRSFQVAFDTVAKENAGFNTFGWDTGDTNGDRIRNSYDKGDTNKNGKQDSGEVFVGSKTYGETWTGVYTLTNPADANDKSAIVALESAINANLDPKLHITIADDLTITMANSAKDPWKTEYHGVYLTNATTDGKDRGAIVMYSNGANQEFGSEHSIAGGVVTVNVPGNNKIGQDDYAIVSCYTYLNGYGEVKNMTVGFSNNQSFLTTTPNNTTSESLVNTNGSATFNKMVSENCDCEPFDGMVFHDCLIDISPVTLSWDELMLQENGSKYGYNVSAISNIAIDDYAFVACFCLTDLKLPNTVTTIGEGAFYYCTLLSKVEIPDSVTTINMGAFNFSGLTSIKLPNNITTIADSLFGYCFELRSVEIPKTVTSIGEYAFDHCTSLQEMVFKGTINEWMSIDKKHVWQGVHDRGEYTAIQAEYVQCADGLFYYGVNGIYFTLQNDNTYSATGMYQSVNKNLIISETVNDIPVTTIATELFWANPTSITIPKSVKQIWIGAFAGCDNLEQIIFDGTIEEWENINIYGESHTSGWDILDSVYIKYSDSPTLSESIVAINDIDCSGPYNIVYYTYENDILVEKTARVEACGGTTICAAIGTEIYIDTTNTIGVYNQNYDYEEKINDYHYNNNGVYVVVPYKANCYIDIFS